MLLMDNDETATVKVSGKPKWAKNLSYYKYSLPLLVISVSLFIIELIIGETERLRSTHTQAHTLQTNAKYLFLF